jgi:hypothetical protein
LKQSGLDSNSLERQCKGKRRRNKYQNDAFPFQGCP